MKLMCLVAFVSILVSFSALQYCASAAPAQLGCAGNQPTSIVKTYRKRYNLLKISTTTAPFAKLFHNSNCPWKYVRDDATNRIPQSLSKASLSSTYTRCKPIYYTHYVLVKKCDGQIGEADTWSWETLALPVAYVFQTI